MGVVCVGVVCVGVVCVGVVCGGVVCGPVQQMYVHRYLRYHIAPFILCCMVLRYIA